jgi:microcystin-dependent protein
MGLSVGLGTVTQVPAGIVSAFAGTTAPSGWLMCYGQAVSRTDYSALFTALSTTYGSGDGSTTFNIPDMRGRAVAGVDNMGGTAASRLTSTVLTASNTLGATGGTQTHTLITAELASHNHTQDSHNHTQSSHNHTQDSHNHTQSSHNHTQNAHDHIVGTYEGTQAVQGGTGDLYYSRRGDLTYQPMTTSGTTATNQATTATNTATTATNQATTATNTATTATNQAAGSGSAHLNTQPTLVLNYIIKATQ